ncbi:DUF4270 family protein [Ekhidna sp.]
MRKERVIGVLVLCVGILSCSESSVIGEDFIESTDYQITLNNSIPIEFTTVRFDSLITSQSDRLLIGGQNDTSFGDLNIETYFLLDLIESESTDNLQYDSITLTIPMDGYSLYLDDVTIRQTVVLEQLVGELEYLEDEAALYNYSDIEGATDVPGTILAEREFLWATDRIRDLEMRLPDLFGEDLFNRLENDDDIFSDQEEANEYLKGFRLYLKDPAFIVGLSRDSLKLTIHTTDISSTSLSNIDFDFFIGLQPQYSKFSHTNIPDALVVEELDDEIASDNLDDNAYIIGGLGYATKIDITGVRDLLLDGEEFILADAELKIRWFEHEQEKYPQTLTVSLINEDFADVTGGQTFTLNQVFDDEYGRDNYYLMDATQIVEFILNQPFGGEYYLLLTASDFNTSPTHVILGDRSSDSEINIYTIKN